MTHIIVDESSYKYGNFMHSPEKCFLRVTETSFKECSEEDLKSITDKKNNLNLVGDRDKVLIEVNPGAFHHITGFYGSIANALEMFNNPLFVINVSKIKAGDCSESFISFFYYFLDDMNIDHVCVDWEDNVGITINNFYLFKFGEYPIPNAINKIHKMFLKYVDDKSAIAYKKVYVSRKKVTGAPLYQVQDKNYLIRIDDETKIEKFFQARGFEIVYPEDFKSLKDQINYFHTVKTLASISGGGALNLIFMQDGGNVLEIVSPLFSGYGSEIKDLDTGEPANWVLAHHNFFSNISFKRNLSYVGIPSSEKKSEIVLKRIINSKPAMSLIGEYK